MVPEFGGLIGVPGASENIEQLILQDMQTRERFLNFMELSRDPSCVVSAQVRFFSSVVYIMCISWNESKLDNFLIE